MTNSNEYTSAQMLAMQKDAVRRVNEMQRISREKLKQTAASFEGNSQKQYTASPNTGKDKLHQKSSHQHCHPPNYRGQAEDQSSYRQSSDSQNSSDSQETSEPVSVETEIMPNNFQGFLQRLNLDHESILLIVMLILLVNEGSDIMLIMALVYILL